MNSYDYVALIVHGKSGEVKGAFGARWADPQKDKPELLEEAEKISEKKISLNENTSVACLESIYAQDSPGYRYVRIGGVWHRVPVVQ